MTPYGESTVIETRDDVITICEPNKWKLATSKPPTYYLNKNDVKPFYAIGEKVSCVWGHGAIQNIREDGVYVVTLNNWTLADGKSPTLYLQESALSKIVKKKKDKKNFMEECIKKAVGLKAEAGKLFNAGKYAEAYEKYLASLTAMHTQSPENLTNRERAMVFEQTVPCHNNLSLCSFKMNKMAQCIEFAHNSLTLISALQSKIASGSEIWKVLTKERGMTMEKLLELKKKAHFNIGKASAEKKDHDTAVKHLEEALLISNKDPSKATDSAKIQAMLSAEKKKRSNDLKKEKKTWKKAFSENQKVVEETDKVKGRNASNGSSSASKANGKPSGNISQDAINDILSGKKVDLKKAGLLATAGDGDDDDDDSGKDASGESSIAGWAAATGLFAFVGIGAYLFLRSRQHR